MLLPKVGATSRPRKKPGGVGAKDWLNGGGEIEYA